MSEKLPKATHSGEVKIGNCILKCHQLDNGKTIIETDSFESFFKMMEDGTLFENISQTEIEDGVRKLKQFGL